MKFRYYSSSFAWLPIHLLSILGMEIERFFLHDFNIDNNVEKKVGGEATVSKAWHPRFGEVAIKQWTKPLYNIENEIELLIKNFNHPNIIQFVGMLIDNKSSYIGYIMPYMSLGSLHDAEKYGEKQISSWITQICCGLSHLHFKKIIHRDIKPSNVLLGKSHDDVKLFDFGMAKSLKDVSHTFTGVGTKLYMAPEIMKGEKYNFSADIYSLSITIWEILHRRKPYDHVECSNMLEEYELFYKIYRGERPQLDNHLSKEVSELLMRCWDADASKRPTINHVAEFFNKTKFLYTNLKNVVNEPVASSEILNVHNSNESLLPIPLGKPIEKKPEKQTILLLGGFVIVQGPVDSLLMLENNGQNWKQLNIKLPYATYTHGAQFLNNHLYIFGGEGEGGTLNWTYKLSKSLRWERMADMNKKRRDISNSSVILNNQIWVCGGRDEEETLKSVEMYDPLTKKWKHMKEMNERRSRAAAAVANRKIFCAGGSNVAILNSVECYDPSSDVWTFICNMPQNIEGHGAVGIDGNLIVMGGCYYLAWFNVWALDTTNKNAEWIEKPSMSISRVHFSIAKIHDEIFICGGWSAGESVEIFDGKMWRNGPKMPTIRGSSPAVVVPMDFARYLK